MDRALQLVLKGEFTVREASTCYGIPRETLRRRMEQMKKGITREKRLGRFDTVFPPALENELAVHIALMENDSLA